MYNLQGFLAVDGLANASPSAVAAIGEISSKSLTYSRGFSEFASTTLPYRLYGFYSKTASGQYNAPADLINQIWLIADWAFNKQRSGSPATNSTAFIAALQAQFGTATGSAGAGVLVDAGGFLFPEYVSWTNPNITTNDPDQGAEVKLWFSDASFQSQYGKYEIVVTPPLASVDSLQNGYSAVKTAIESIDAATMINASQSAAGIYPYTMLVPTTFDYVDPSNDANTVVTTWNLLIYGAAGNNADYIREAIKAYIAANSSFGVVSWRKILPSLYTSTEFMLFPRWKDYAVAEMVGTQGAYSATVNLAKQLAYLKTALPSMSATYIDEHAAVIPSNYRSVQLIVVPGAENGTSMRDIGDVFDDLMNVPTTDPLFNEMRVRTRSWVTMILTMLIQAENATAQTSLPAGMSLVVRDNVLYVAQSYLGVAYLVAAKSTLPAYS